MAITVGITDYIRLFFFLVAPSFKHFKINKIVQTDKRNRSLLILATLLIINHANYK